MAPTGQKLGKLVHPACQHSPFAKAYLNSHMCWQDRIGKETNAEIMVSSTLRPLQEQSSKPPQKSQSLTALELARSEYHPIGGNSKHNNASGQVAATLGPKSWHASGGLKSEYRAALGQTMLPQFGSPPQASPDMSASYLPKAVRAEGRRKGRADQIEAIRQHGEGTIIRLQRGDMPPMNPAEEQVFRGGGPIPQSGGQVRAQSGGASCRSRLSDESWGSVRSNPESELRRIDELGAKARAIGRKNARAHQLEPVQQHGENTILGIGKGKIATNNPVEEQLLAHRG